MNITSYKLFLLKYANSLGMHEEYSYPWLSLVVAVQLIWSNTWRILRVGVGLASREHPNVFLNRWSLKDNLWRIPKHANLWRHTLSMLMPLVNGAIPVSVNIRLYTHESASTTSLRPWKIHVAHDRWWRQYWQLLMVAARLYTEESGYIVE